MPAPTHPLEDAWPAALTWIDGALTDAGLTATGPVERTRLRPWGLVARIPVGTGTLWFKANGSCSLYEAPLLAALARWTPGRVLEPIATQAERGWSLLPDGGATLRDTAADDPGHWEEMLARHSRLQLDLTAHTDAMLAFGVPDVRPHRLPEHLDDLLDDPGVRAGLAEDRLTALTAYAPTYRRLCERLAAGVVPMSLQHDDLHDGNVLVGNGYRFFDWGDASVAHPFGVLLIALRSVADRYGLGADDPVLARLRDAYLEPWTGFGTRAELLAEVTLAVQVTKVSRSLCWRRSMVDAQDGERAEWGPAVWGWLEELLDPDGDAARAYE